MNRILQAVSLLCLGLALWACQSEGGSGTTEQSYTVSSPDQKIKVQFFLTEAGQPAYTALHQGQIVLDTSTLGFALRNAEPLQENFEIMAADSSTVDDTWEMPWGEQREVRNHYQELKIALRQKGENPRELNIIFRVFDDGLGFRYEFPEQANFKEVVIMDENTQFQLTEDYTCWWIPGDWDIYEHLYNTTPLSEIDATTKRDHPNLAQTYIPENAVATPVTMRGKNGLHLSFHEAALTDYSDMTLKVDTKTFLLQSELVGSPDSSKVKRTLPFVTPWRTVQIAEKAGDLIESKLIVNLNEPNRLGDVSWFTPMKYVGIWWEMHLGKSTWKKEGGKHGATTENAKRYIDFAAANNIGGLLVEGWNTGWEDWLGEDREGVFDFVTNYDDYDIKEVVRYGREKGVQVIMHHETSAAVNTYNQQMELAFQLCEDLGIHAVKTGYVGKIIPRGEFHHGQFMVNHYRKAVETAAKHQVAVNAHEPIKATGIRRTYPNVIAREGLRGQEFNAWSVDLNPPEHLPIVAFTRMLAGPIDFTPGIFNIKFDEYKEKEQVNTTLAHQLALYVVIYSPVQMAADLPEHYEGKPALGFIRDVAVDWEQSKVLNGEVGDFVTIARQERGGERWFLGSITDENARELDLTLDFLKEGQKYKATFYRDAADAHWDENPLAMEIEEFIVDKNTKIKLSLAAGGGAALSFVPATEIDLAEVKVYE